jgi:NADPH:quinone reductase-like Zn-dependent oxidoreductase
MIGAKIYATVGNQEKIEHLVNNFGIPRENIYSSRNVDFLHQIKRATNGRGVDVALNSLSGDLLHATVTVCIHSELSALC